MKLVKQPFLLFLFFALISSSSCSDDNNNSTTPNPTEATYEVTFTFDWSEKNFPADYPSNPHFSPLIGWSHKDTDYLKIGTMATEGIKIMAETGGTSTMKSELDKMIADGEGLQSVIGSGVSGSGVGAITVEIKVNNQYPMVSLVTMVAPSPDWYVGAVNVSLLENGEFVSMKTIEELPVYDAGTDSGSTYTSPNAPTDPKENISMFVSAPLGDGTELIGTIASVTFKKK